MSVVNTSKETRISKMSMRNHVVIFEARGGNDKGPYVYRKDSMPIVKSLQDRGWPAYRV